MADSLEPALAEGEREALQPCPFCGQSAALQHYARNDDSAAPRPHHAYRVACEFCEISLLETGSQWWGSEYDPMPPEDESDLAARRSVISRWNTRPALAQMTRERDAAVAENARVLAQPAQKKIDRLRRELSAMAARAHSDGWHLMHDGHSQDLAAAAAVLRGTATALASTSQPEGGA